VSGGDAASERWHVSVSRGTKLAIVDFGRPTGLGTGASLASQAGLLQEKDLGVSVRPLYRQNGRPVFFGPGQLNFGGDPGVRGRRPDRLVQRPARQRACPE
jgi:hypothetical protein